MVSSKVRLGWNSFFEAQASEVLAAAGHPQTRWSFARVVEEQRGAYRLRGDVDDWAEVSGRFRHAADSVAAFPVVGDWVVAAGETSCIIHEVLPRRSALSRAAAGRASAQQMIAANIDTVFVVTAAADDLNPRRLERYLAMVWDSGATPVIVVNKIDIVDSADAVVAELGPRLPFVDIVTTSAIGHGAVSALTKYLETGRTVALVGSSGVGKSTLVNRLVGTALQATAAVRDRDGRGRHTTTARQLIELPGGALLIDTPGMRELTPWADPTAIDATFDDIQRLAADCRYSDCAHDGEPGCSVRAAIDDGRLDADRLDHSRRLLKEAAFEAEKHDHALAAEKKRLWKRAARAQRSLYRDRDR
jgi:ribosome biogenesis GTPase / thiamine phosphate phosphatase